jgi:hypothetical protein
VVDADDPVEARAEVTELIAALLSGLRAPAA